MRGIDYEERVYHAMNHMSRNLESDMSLEEIAGAAGFSAFHFHRIFKAVAGENVAEFARRLRLELAANRLLSKPRESITSVAVSCGFSSSQNFAKAFRQAYGKTPGMYRVEGAENAAGRSVAGPGPTARAAQMVSVREFPASAAATIRRIGAYEDTCPDAFRELLAWAETSPGPGQLMALYWDNPEVTPRDKLRFDCCLLANDCPPASGNVFFQDLGGGPWAFCRFEAAAEEIRGAWEMSFRWLVESGLGCRPLPCCEIYHNDARFHPEGKWIIDIAIPLEYD
jgi:AraC family transcriptional regulator